MNFILNLTRRIRRALQSLIGTTEDPFLLEEVTITRFSNGLFKRNKECTNCEDIKACIRTCIKCKAYVCSTCFVKFIIEEISFKTLCRQNHARTISALIINSEEESYNSLTNNI